MVTIYNNVQHERETEQLLSVGTEMLSLFSTSEVRGLEFTPHPMSSIGVRCGSEASDSANENKPLYDSSRFQKIIGLQLEGLVSVFATD